MDNLEIASDVISTAGRPKTLLYALGVTAFCGSIYGVGKLVGRARQKKTDKVTEPTSGVIDTTAK